MNRFLCNDIISPEKKIHKKIFPGLFTSPRIIIVHQTLNGGVASPPRKLLYKTFLIVTSDFLISLFFVLHSTSNSLLFIPISSIDSNPLTSVRKVCRECEVSLDIFFFFSLLSFVSKEEVNNKHECMKKMYNKYKICRKELV